MEAASSSRTILRISASLGAQAIVASAAMIPTTKTEASPRPKNLHFHFIVLLSKVKYLQLNLFCTLVVDVQLLLLRETLWAGLAWLTSPVDAKAFKQFVSGADKPPSKV